MATRANTATKGNGMQTSDASSAASNSTNKTPVQAPSTSTMAASSPSTTAQTSASPAIASPRMLPFFKVSSGMASQPAQTSSLSAAKQTKGRTRSVNTASPSTSRDQGESPSHNGKKQSVTRTNGEKKSLPAQGSEAKSSTSARPKPLTPSAEGGKMQSSPGGKSKAAESSRSPSSSMEKSQSPHTASDTGKKAPKRRKANRACSHCQKAHLTCDDARPCERCVKKGLADSCTDGARKKAKYLLDDDELLELKREKEQKENTTKAGTSGPSLRHAAASGSGPLQSVNAIPQASQDWLGNNGVGNNNDGMTISAMAPAQQVSALPYLPNQKSAFDAASSGSGTDGTPSYHHVEGEIYPQLSAFSPTSSNNLNNAFGSESASLEYSILSSMLNGIDPSWLSGSPDGQQAETDMNRILRVTEPPYRQLPANSMEEMGWNLQGFAQQPQQQSNFADVSPWLNVAAPSGSNDSFSQQNAHGVEPLPNLQLVRPARSTAADDITAYEALEVPSPNGSSAEGANGKAPKITVDGAEQNAQSSKALAAAAAAGLDHKPDAAFKDRVRHVYGDRMRPFPYTEGYHFLIKYVTANLEKADVLRLIRALAIFRPSLIALQMPLTEDDEIFVERSIQRAILEFEKLIPFSGTPTVVWRRTCEIVVVGAEFSMLTQWSRDYLRGRYIYEFFEKPSILEYWEKFAAHAFENTAQSIMMPITLKTSTGGTTRCAACISIKRDMFDLPSLIVGNFLPILG